MNLFNPFFARIVQYSLELVTGVYGATLLILSELLVLSSAI